MKEQKYAILGYYDVTDEVTLQWSDDFGWCLPEMADWYEAEDLFGSLPMETTGIIDKDSGKTFTLEEFYVMFQVP